MKKSHATRILSLLLALVLSVSLCPPALADWVDFSDVSPSHWAYDSIMYCSEWNIVTGYEDGRFLPDDQVTSVQFVAMITRTFYNDEVEETKKSQPAGSPWYWANTKVAADKYLTTNMTINDNAMNRYDMANVAKNVLIGINQGFLPDSGVHWGLDPRLDNVPGQVNDWSSVPINRTAAIKVCYATGVLTGMSDGQFHGEESMTRAQACVVITRMLNLIQGEPPAAPSQPQQPETPAQSGTGLLANGQEATVENVQAILDEIQREYPAGTIWCDPSVNSTTNYYKDGGVYNSDRDVRNIIYKFDSVDLQYGCGGFATMVSERIFGKTGAPGREVTDISKARPGDIVIKLRNDGTISHVAIFTGYDPTPRGSFTMGKFSTCDGNNSGKVYWSSPYLDASDVGTRYRIYTRYPA